MSHCTFREASGHVVLHVLVLPEPLIDVPWRQFPALLHHDPGIQKLQRNAHASARTDT